MTGPARTLLVSTPHPGRALRQIWIHELAERQRYRRAAFRFLTLDPATSRLLALVGVECEARLARLEQLAWQQRLIEGFSDPRRPHPTPIAKDNDALAVARRLFSQAISAAKRTQHFYEAMCESNDMEPLQAFLDESFNQKRAEHRLLLEHLDSLPLGASTPSFDATSFSRSLSGRSIS